MDLNMRLARADEAARVLAVLEDGKRSIARFGIGQWQDGYPDLAAVERDIAAGAGYVAEDAAGLFAGTLAFCRGADSDYEASGIAWLAPGGRYASLHRCATAADALGQGVMSFLFAEAERMARAEGFATLRVDTHPGNKAMRGLIESCGFTELGRFDLTSHRGADPTRIAYEKPLSTK